MAATPPTNTDTVASSAAQAVAAAAAALGGLRTESSTEHKPEAEQLSPEVKAAVIKQVEFYFSDANLPTDEFLIKQVKKSAHGWVNLHLVAKFKRMRALTTSVPAIAAALRESEELVVSGDGNAVRRKAALPETDDAEVAERTVIAEHLPRDKHSIEALTELFSQCGSVRMVRMCQPGQVRSTAQAEATGKGGKLVSNNQIVSNQVHALVEYATVEEAAIACKELTDDSTWRAGLKVRPLVRGKKQWGHYHDQHQQESDGGNHEHDKGHSDVAKLPVAPSPQLGVATKKTTGKQAQGSATPDGPAASSPLAGDAVAQALAMARKATAIAVSSSRRRSLESSGNRRGSLDSRGGGKAAATQRLSRASFDTGAQARHSMDVHELPSYNAKKPVQAVGAAAVFDAFASSAPRTAPTTQETQATDSHAKSIARHLQEEMNNNTSGASTGDNTSSGGEDAEERKSRRQRRKDYASWASGVSAAAHRPGEKDHHGVYQPVMPDGSRGFSHGRGKPMAPPSEH